MRPEAKKYLHDMLEACLAVQRFSAAKSLEDYREDAYLRSAVERQLQILGEAMAQLAKRHPDTAERFPDHRAIINFRNVLVHGYDAVDHDVVWGLVMSKVPPLATMVEKVLTDAESL